MHSAASPGRRRKFANIVVALAFAPHRQSVSARFGVSALLLRVAGRRCRSAASAISDGWSSSAAVVAVPWTCALALVAKERRRPALQNHVLPACAIGARTLSDESRTYSPRTPKQQRLSPSPDAGNHPVMKKLSLRRCLYFTQAGLRTTPERIREKFELFDFELDAGEVERIDALDRR